MELLASPIFIDKGWLTILPGLIAKGEAAAAQHPEWRAAQLQQVLIYQEALDFLRLHPGFRGDFRATLPAGLLEAAQHPGAFDAGASLDWSTFALAGAAVVAGAWLL